MTAPLSAAQMRRIEEQAISSGAVTGLELMERAGRGVIEAVREEWPELAHGSHRALVLCGPGNNGGDGFVVARLLRKTGWEIDLYLYGEQAKLPPDAAANARLWAELGQIYPWDDKAIENHLEGGRSGEPEAVDPDLVVDALFGIGLTRKTPDDMDLTRRGFARAVARQPASDRAKFVAIDIPSGLHSDTGADLGMLPSDLTVTFHRAKLGHRTAEGPACCGKVVIKDIGL